MIKRLSILMLCLVAGCVSTSPVIPPRFQILVPSASAADPVPGVVYLQYVYSSYNLTMLAYTNNGSIDPGSPAYSDIATNRSPYKRLHLDLSIDGGATWPYRIGYGVQFDDSLVRCDYVWSPPHDYSLLTTNALIRAMPLDGSPWIQRNPAMPYDIKPGCFPVSAPFPIVGAIIDSPAAGSIQWRGEGTTIAWRQVGGGAVWNLYWLTPASAGIDVMHWITTISNVVHGANTKIVSLNVPAAPGVRLAIVSAGDNYIVGYSDSFTVDP